MPEKLFGIDELRRAVRMFDDVHEEFNTRFTAEQLLKIWRAAHACEWDYYPDQWSEKQVKAALRGKVPTFEE